MPALKRTRTIETTTVAPPKKKVKPTLTVRIPRTLRSFPNQMRVRLKYQSYFDASIPSTGPVYYFWRANSIFDPDAAVGGGQPRGFSQWSNFYEKYHVMGANCQLRLLDKDTGTSTTGTVTGLYGVALKDSTTAITSIKEFTEDDDSVYSGYDSWHAANKLMLKFDVKKHFGIQDILDNDNLGGTTGVTFGANPVDQAFFVTWANQAPSSGSASQPFAWDVLLTYDVVFSDPKDLV